MVRLFIVSDYESIHRKGGALSCYMIKNSSSPENDKQKSPKALTPGLCFNSFAQFALLPEHSCNVPGLLPNVFSNSCY